MSSNASTGLWLRAQAKRSEVHARPGCEARSGRDRGLDPQDSPHRALRLVSELRAAFRKIAENPMLYRVRTEIGEDTRLFVAGRYVILFRIEDERVRFERVVYGGRDLSALYR